MVLNEENSVTSLDREDVSRFFLKRRKRWADGQPVEVFERQGSAELTQLWARHIHGRSVRAIESFWQRRIFSGQGTPPQRFDTDRQVLEHVAATSGGIGWVSCRARRIEGVRTLTIRGTTDQAMGRLQEPESVLDAGWILASFEVRKEIARRGAVRLLDVGACGLDGRRLVVVNDALEDSYDVGVLRYIEGLAKGDVGVERLQLQPGHQRPLTCRPMKTIDDVDRPPLLLWALRQPSEDAPPEDHVAWVSAGLCRHRDVAGQWTWKLRQGLISLHPDKSLDVAFKSVHRNCRRTPLGERNQRLMGHRGLAPKDLFPLQCPPPSTCSRHQIVAVHMKNDP